MSLFGGSWEGPTGGGLGEERGEVRGIVYCLVSCGHQAGEALPVDKCLTCACSEPSWCLEVPGYSCFWSSRCGIGHEESCTGPRVAPREAVKAHLVRGTAAAEAWHGRVGDAREKLGTQGTGS